MCVFPTKIPVKNKSCLYPDEMTPNVRFSDKNSRQKYFWTDKNIFYLAKSLKILQIDKNRDFLRFFKKFSKILKIFIRQNHYRNFFKNFKKIFSNVNQAKTDPSIFAIFSKFSELSSSRQKFAKISKIYFPISITKKSLRAKRLFKSPYASVRIF